MITFIEKRKRIGIIPDQAKRIISYLSDKPYLYLPMSMVIPHCLDNEKNTVTRIENAFETAEVEPDLRNHLEEVEYFKKLLIEYYTVKDEKWAVADRRGLLLEELIASISPLKFDFFNYKENVRIYRDAIIYIESKPISDLEIDVVFCDDDMLINAIECKITIAGYLLPRRRKRGIGLALDKSILCCLLTRKGKRLKETALKKLEFFTQFQESCKKWDSQFYPWFCTMQKDVSYEKKLLKKSGFANVGIITGDVIHRILNAS